MKQYLTASPSKEKMFLNDHNEKQEKSDWLETLSTNDHHLVNFVFTKGMVKT